ncbi:hypothetical protein [Methylorubrum extorquens]|uniref:hypothetical protein n=1 Tax=Methylorubrum extorquens TaxID=408 RepID=UPI0020A1FEB7|nr:hypothetical protein [Methylorubrum extorquens]MCP1540126.1 hypothetical protein [Methylorubrum extorquens]
MHTHETILALLQTSDRAVKRAIKALEPFGFDGPDGEFLADIHRKLPLYNDNMTPPQYRRARKALPGYLDRLVEIANRAVAPAPAQEPLEEPAEVFSADEVDRWRWGSW